MSNGKTYLGVDIGGTSVKLGLVDEQGVIRYSEDYDVAFDRYETPILKTVLKSMKLFLAEHEVTEQELAGIGVSATGGIDTVNGVVIGSAGHIQNWEGSRIKEEMEKMFHLPTTVLNDANAAALGEMWIGAAADRRNVIVMTVGTGVGGGIIVDSKILLGANGLAGEIGHIVINSDGELCSCGNHGCMEHYGSTTALIRRVRDAASCGKIILPEEQELDGRFIFSEAEKGSTAMLELLDSWIDDIASGLVGLVHIFNPELILIGGGVSAQKELFIDRLREKVMARCMPHFVKHLELKAAELGNDAGLIGAVYYCIQQNDLVCDK